MKRLVLIFVLVAGIVVSPFAKAEEPVYASLTDEQIELIRSNCFNIQTQLNRIHANDGLLRVNLAQHYNAISSKLMAPMNSRISLNKLDGLALATTTVDYNKKIKNFTDAYYQYETTLSKALSIKCSDQPVEFYDTLTLARSQRPDVNSEVAELNKLVRQYIDQFKTFRLGLKANGADV